jgi:hypothetical protein
MDRPGRNRAPPDAFCIYTASIDMEKPMEKTALGLIAAFGAAVAAAPASASVATASTDNIFNPTSVAELLDPIPNALAAMNELNAGGRTLEPVDVAELGVTIGPDGVRIGHRHHHHHHHWRRHHHHHHHHNY